MDEPTALPIDAPHVLSGGGAAGEVLRATDWSKNPLGPIAAWPLALKTIVRTMLSSRQAMCLFWGAELINLYNDGFIPILGEKHSSAMGQRAEECWSDAWPVVGGLITNVMARGQAVLFEEMLVPIVRNGQLQDAWWNYSYSPAFDDEGTIVGVLIVATETTNEVATRKQLEAARQEMHAVFMQAPLPIALLKGADHLFTLVNDPYRALVQRDVLGKTLCEAFSDEEVGYYRRFIETVYRTGEPMSVRDAPLRLPDHEGVIHDRFIDVNYHPYRDVDGNVAGVLAIIHDVTPNVISRMQEASLRETAESASRAKDEFLATVSHELRNPLNAILGWARILAAGRESPRVQKGLDVILRNAVQQTKLIDDILDMSRIIAGKTVVSFRRVHLAHVIRTAVDSVYPAATAKRIRLEVSLEEADFDLVADEDRLQQVIWNLLSNAVKFTNTGGEVRVTAARDGSRVAVRVEDNGKGIAPAFLPHVFDRFRQADATPAKQYGGLGLGLAIVRHLVELHGGTVSARSEGEGRGATFEIVLPVRAVEPREHLVPAPPAAAAMHLDSLESASLEGVRVLVVDDEVDARDLVATVLGEAAAHVTVASTVVEAMRALGSASFDVVVSDIGMPFEDGYSLAERVRSEGPRAMRDIPMLALTAYARSEDRQRARRAGFEGHVAKPVDPEVLIRTVAALARRTDPERSVEHH